MQGESTKYRLELFAKTDRLYTKRFEEETNLALPYYHWQFLVDALQKLKIVGLYENKLDSPFWLRQF
jgi:hypothetical protein